MVEGGWGVWVGGGGVWVGCAGVGTAAGHFVCRFEGLRVWWFGGLGWEWEWEWVYIDGGQ